jgi:endonuclease YncB( thermonuclease family)
MVSVYDGDTFTADIPEFPPVVGDKIGIRLDGIDTPEMNDKRPEIKILAQKAKLVLKTSLANAKRITITDIKRDKYFRLDATVIADGVNLNELMIKLELAKPYDGGKKSPW